MVMVMTVGIVRGVELVVMIDVGIGALMMMLGTGVVMTAVSAVLVVRCVLILVMLLAKVMV